MDVIVEAFQVSPSHDQVEYCEKEKERLIDDKDPCMDTGNTNPSQPPHVSEQNMASADTTEDDHSDKSFVGLMLVLDATNQKVQQLQRELDALRAQRASSP